MYAALLARSLKYSSVKQYLNIVRILHLDWGLPNPMEDNFPLSCVLKGIRRGLGDQPQRKLPITPKLLHCILVSLDLTIILDAQVWAACLLLFYAMLRRSNVLSASLSSFDASRHLRRSDVKFHQSGITLIIRWTKTIQYKQRILRIPLPRQPGHPMCPTQALFHALQLTRGAPADGPALVMPSTRGFIPLTPQLFVSKIRSALQAAGVDPKPYAGHSFRRGGATWAYRCSVPIETIRQIGDWKSTAYQDYIIPSDDSILAATRLMQGSIKVL